MLARLRTTAACMYLGLKLHVYWVLLHRDTYVALEAGLCAARGEWQGPRKGLSGTALGGKQETAASTKEQQETNKQTGSNGIVTQFK